MFSRHSLNRLSILSHNVTPTSAGLIQLTGIDSNVLWTAQPQILASRSSNFSSQSGDDYQYLHRSIVPTDHFQRSLPRLPIPKLEKTCDRYLASQNALLGDAAYATTEKLVTEFRNGVGKELHMDLIAWDKQNKHTSYIAEPWFDMYLRDRKPVVINFNPFLSYYDDKNEEMNDMVIKATNMLISSLRFYRAYHDNILEPEVFHLNPSKSDTAEFRNFVRRLPKLVSWYGAYWYKAFPLCMSQFPRLFNSTRIPRPEKDELITIPNRKHLMVMRNGHFYMLDVFDRDGKILPADVLLAHMRFISKDSRSDQPADHPVGILTSEERNTWANVREHISQLSDTNRNIFELIDSALFTLILDETEFTELNAMTKLFLHGDGNNRWYDKSFSLILAKSGKAGVHFEHAWGDGVAVMRYFNEIYHDSTSNYFVHPKTVAAQVDSSSAVQKLEFALDTRAEEAIKEAQRNFTSLVSSLDNHHLEYWRFNRGYVKQQKISPDSIMQLAIQMAYYRQHGKIVPTYESCSTSAFRHGRTETIRSATSATKHASQLFVDHLDSSSLAELREALQKCSDIHQELTKNAAMGQGFDRHLFGMKHMASLHGKPLPALYSDPSFDQINRIILSTSTLVSPAVHGGGFGPSEHNGYGCGYAIEEYRVGFNVTAYKAECDVWDFIECLKQSVDDIYAVLENKKPTSNLGLV